MLEIRAALPAELPQAFDLRWRVLREPLGEPRGSEQDEYDTLAQTIHGAAFVNGQLVGTGRINSPVECPGEVQVRYMATDLAFRGRGIGGKILTLMEAVVPASIPGASGIILNARKDAVTLYQRAGYALDSDEIELHGIPHYRMRKSLQ